jgi:hypothetical protein
MEYGGTHARQSDLFGTQDAVVKITKTFFKVSMLVETVYFTTNLLTSAVVFLLLINIYISFSVNPG